MKDLIDRQAAIDALGNAGLINYAATGSSNGLIHAMNVIKGLPAAQPERMRGRLLNEDELRDLRVTLDGLCTYLGYIAQDVIGATHYQHRVNEMLVMIMKEGEG